MKHAILILLALLGVVTGCSTSTSGPSASPTVTTQAGCEREGGAWNVATGTCDFGGKGK